MEAFRGTHRHILDYLIEEVVTASRKNCSTADIHPRSVVARLCVVVTGQQDSRQVLRYLETNNLFLVALDEERTWHRHHALFGELLRNQLLQTEPDQ